MRDIGVPSRHERSKLANKLAKTVQDQMVNWTEDNFTYFEQTMDMIYRLSEYKNLTVQGLMCIPPVDDTEEVRKYFAAMRKLFVDISDKKIDNINMSILSMGMSGDYKWAIAEGSTLIRVGTGIFGERNYNK